MKLTLPKRKFVYVFSMRLAVIPIPLWIGKVGNSADAENRARAIEQSIYEKTGVRVELAVFLKIKLFLWAAIEKAVHRVFKPLNVRLKILEGVSGFTELFWNVNVFAGLAIYILLWGLNVSAPVPYALFVMLLPWPLDFSLGVLLLAVVEWALILGLIWLVTFTIPVLIGLF